jgi:hypothetical protein
MNDGVERFSRTRAELSADSVGDGDHCRLHHFLIRDAEELRGLAFMREVRSSLIPESPVADTVNS